MLLTAVLLLAIVQRTSSLCVAEFLTQPPTWLKCNPINRSVILSCSLIMTKFTNITLVWMAFQNGQPVSLLLFQKDTYKASEYKTMVMANIEIDLVYKMFDETSISYLWCQAYMTDLMLLPPSRSIRLQAINTNNELPQCHHNEIFAFPSQQCLFEYSMFMRSTSLPTVRYQPITTARRTANSNTDQQTNYNKCSGAEIAIIVLTEFITLVVFILVGFLIAYIVWRKYKFHIQASEVDEDTEIRHHCNECVETNAEIINNNRTSLPRITQIERPARSIYMSEDASYEEMNNQDHA